MGVYVVSFPRHRTTCWCGIYKQQWIQRKQEGMMLMLRDFSWRYFASTGDIHAYLLYRENCLEAAAVIDEAADSTQSEPGETQVCL